MLISRDGSPVYRDEIYVQNKEKNKEAVKPAFLYSGECFWSRAVE